MIFQRFSIMDYQSYLHVTPIRQSNAETLLLEQADSVYECGWFGVYIRYLKCQNLVDEVMWLTYAHKFS